MALVAKFTYIFPTINLHIQAPSYRLLVKETITFTFMLMTWHALNAILRDTRLKNGPKLSMKNLKMTVTFQMLRHRR